MTPATDRERDEGRQRRMKFPHPDGWVEVKTPNEIRREYAMGIGEYAYFMCLETPEAAREMRRKRRAAVSKGTAQPCPLPGRMSRRETQRYKSMLNRIFSSVFADIREERERAEERSSKEAPGSLIGGIKASGIKSREHVTPTPIDPELSREERRKIWQAPVTDTSRFTGTSGSRHRASSAVKDPSEYLSAALDDPSMPGYTHDKPTKARREEARRGGSKDGGKPRGSGKGRGKPKKAVGTQRPGANRATGGSPAHNRSLTYGERKLLDKTFRIWGANPQWKGWESLIEGMDADYLLEQAKALGYDEPDDSTWTAEEARKFDEKRKELWAGASSWRHFLPRKSSGAIAAAYGARSLVRSGLRGKRLKKAYCKLAEELARLTGGQA